MQNIFWLMWLADFVSTASFVFGLIGFVALICFCVVATNRGDLDPTDKEHKAVIRFGKFCGISALLCLTFVIVSPNKSTIHAMIAIQAGEAAVQTKIGDKAFKALDAVLDRVIAGENKGK